MRIKDLFEELKGKNFTYKIYIPAYDLNKVNISKDKSGTYIINIATPIGNNGVTIF